MLAIMFEPLLSQLLADAIFPWMKSKLIAKLRQPESFASRRLK